MNVSDAVAAAKKYVSDLFAEEAISNLGLEEVERDEAAAQWIVTVGFSRPWDNPFKELSAQLSYGSGYRPRAYKVVRVNDAGNVISVKNRYIEKSDAA
jgi:hypothetical protein